MLPLTIDFASTTAVPAPIPAAIATESVSAWEIASNRASTVTPAPVEVTVASPTWASTVLVIVFVVTDTAPAAATMPAASEKDGSTAAMLAVSAALTVTSPAAVTRAPSPTNARVRAVVELFALDPAPLKAPRPPATEALTV